MIDRRSRTRRGGTLLLPVLLFLVTVLPSGLHAETVRQPEFRRMDPILMGQGGSSVASATGYSALFTNPAGLASEEDNGLTLPSVTVWVHSRPDLLLSTIGTFSGDASDTTADGEEKSQEELIIDVLREQFTTNGFGLGAALGTGYVRNRVGLGLEIGTNSYLYGETFPLGLEGELTTQVSLAVGYAQPLFLGPVSLSLGGALRPVIRVSSFIGSETAADLITTFTGVETGDGEADGSSDDLLDTITALNGWGVSFDAGLLLNYQSFTLGVQGRNLLNTRVDYSNNSLNEILDAARAGGLPSKPTDSSDPSYVSDTYIIPAEISFGAAWRPDLGEYFQVFDPKLHAQVTDPFKITDQNRDQPRSFWTRLHFGTELTLLNFFDLRFGVNQGYFTLGTGLDLGFLEIQYAIYSQEYGRYPGDRQVGGAALEFAFRF